MSTRELRRAVVTERIKSKTLRLTDATNMLELKRSADEETLEALL